MIIYKVTNLINEKIYIGKTSGTLRKRKLGHYWLAFREGSNCPFHKALREFGKRKFKWEIIDKVLFQESLLFCEIKYIKKFNSKYPNGYNGQGGNLKGVILSPLAFGRQNLEPGKLIQFYKEMAEQ